ncbi:MAG: ATP-binding protein [bacterium]
MNFRWKRLRLSARLALMVFLAELLLLAAFGLTTYIFCHRQFLISFDSGLVANAEALASLLEEDDNGQVGLEFSDEIMTRFSKGRRPDLLMIVNGDGTIIDISREFDDPPDWAREPVEEAVFRNFSHDKRDYRGVSLPFEVKTEGPDAAGKHHVTIFFASATHDMDERLEQIARFLAGAVGLLLLISGPVAGLVAYRGLTPLRRLALEAGRIGERSLHLRLTSDPLPADLVPLAGAVNTVLERIEAAFERERRFSSAAAHELRTPLSLLKSGVQAAQLSARDPVSDRKVLEELLEDITRLENLCEVLLALTAADAGEAESAWTAQEWLDCLARVVNEFRPVATSQNSTLELAAPPAPAPSTPMRVDETATRRILANLLDNALRHGGKGIHISVAVEWFNVSATLAVEDDGPGVTDEIESHLFERFFRADKARSRATGGLGLGLSLSRGLARSLGGDLRFQRPTTQRGCRFVWQIAFAS